VLLLCKCCAMEFDGCMRMPSDTDHSLCMCIIGAYVVVECMALTVLNTATMQLCNSW
jgi:phosphate/sulfate permease